MQKLNTADSGKLFKIYTGTLSVAALVATFLLLNPAGSSTTSATTSFTTEVDPTGYTLSLEMVDDVDEVALTANTSGGAKLVGGKNTVRATTNSPTGYQLYLSTANTNLVGTENEENLLPSTSGTYASPAALQANGWGFAIPSQTSKFTGSYTIDATDGTIADTSTLWATVPTTPVQVASEAGAAGGVVTTHDLDFYYAVAADVSLPADTYTGTVTYSAISDATDVTPAASLSPTSQDVKDTAQSLTITTPLMTTMDLTVDDVTVTFSGDGLTTYTCTSSSTDCAVTAVTRADANSDNPNAVIVTVTTPDVSTAATYTVTTNILKFNKSYSATYDYVKNAPNTLADATYLQEVESSTCANTTIADSTNYATTTYTLKDKRDNKQYRVRKLKDGNCWMIDDLSIAGVTVTPADTDMTTGSYTLPSALASGGSTSYTQGYIWQNTGSFAGKYLYNWHAATVSTVDTTTITSGDAVASVCPKGWKLPSGGDANTNQSFAKLYAQYDYNSSSKMRSTTNGGPEFTLAGDWNNGYSYQGSGGFYWSRTAYPSNSYSAYYLGLDSSYVSPQGSSNKYNGFSVRCVTS